MSDTDAFLPRLIAARRAAWIVFMIAVGIQTLTYLIYLAMGQGWMDDMLTSGLYGNSTPDELTRLTLYYLAAFKLMSIGTFLGAMFLTLWVRGLRRID
jgi:hypothetical protein